MRLTKAVAVLVGAILAAGARCDDVIGSRTSERLDKQADPSRRAVPALDRVKWDAVDRSALERAGRAAPHCIARCLSPLAELQKMQVQSPAEK